MGIKCQNVCRCMYPECDCSETEPLPPPWVGQALPNPVPPTNWLVDTPEPKPPTPRELAQQFVTNAEVCSFVDLNNDMRDFFTRLAEEIIQHFTPKAEHDDEN